MTNCLKAAQGSTRTLDEGSKSNPLRSEGKNHLLLPVVGQ